MTPVHIVPVHIVVVDDDPAILQLLDDMLSESDFKVTTAPSAAAMNRVLEAGPVDLIVLDISLPDADGFEVAGRLRATRDIPIIMLTGRGGDIDRIIGLEIGADDYVVKPFNPRELLARIKAVLRRAHGRPIIETAPEPGGHRLIFDGWVLDARERCLTDPEGQQVSLTFGEFNLLEVMASAPKRVLSREQLLDLTHAQNAHVFDRTVDVLILRLRRKIERNPHQPTLIRTERGAGYIFMADVERG